MITDSRSRLQNYITNTLSASESAALTITLTLTDSRSQSRLVIGRLNAVIFFTLVSAHRLTVTVTQLHLEHIVSFRVSNTHNHTHAHRLTLMVTLCHRQIKCCYFFHLSQCSQTHAHAYTITSPTQCTITLMLILMPHHR